MFHSNLTFSELRLSSEIDFPLLILAGGRATRLKHLSEDRPKYLMPVSPTEVFADVHLKWVKSLGFKKVILSIGYLGKQIQDYCQNGQKFGLEIEYIDDGPMPVGTGGALALAASSFSHLIAVTYGDTLLRIDLDSILKKLNSNPKSLSLMTVYKNTVPGHTCNSDFVSESLIHYSKKNPDSKWAYIDYGFLVIKKQALAYFEETRPLDLALPLERISQDQLLTGYAVEERFWEIGTLDSLSEFQQKFGKS